ncbi:MAG: helix-turn-helix domain-containing protein, partial [Shewanella sp.]
MKDHDQIESALTDTLSGAPLAAPSDTLGHILRTAREKMGLSVGDAAVKLHLRPKIVEDLEADVFSNIASATYVRGYVKNFARLVGADAALIDACLAKQVPLVTEPAMQSFSRKTTHQASDTKLKWLSSVIVLILLGLFVVWWMQKSTLLTHVDVSQPTVEEMAAANQSLSAEDLLTQTDVSQRLTDIAVNGSMATDGPVEDSAGANSVMGTDANAGTDALTSADAATGGL